MRASIKTAALFAATAAVIASTLAPAEAASKRYKISMKLTAFELHGKKSTSNKVMDVSNDHEEDYVKIAGKVRGGPVAGKRIRLYATNTTDRRRTRSLGTVKLSKSGKFVKRHRPDRGGRWEYLAVMPKAGKYQGGQRKRRIDAFHWTHMWELSQRDRRHLPIGTKGVARLRGDAREWTGPDNYKGRRIYPGFRWTEEYAINGGSTAVFDVSGYRCKKINLKVGLSDNSVAPSGVIRFSQNGRTLLRLKMVKDQEPFDTMVENRQTRRFKDSLKANGKVRMTVETPNARFLVGNPKVFCTFPSVNR